MLFNKTLQNLEGADAKDVTNIEKYLHKTVGMDLVNMIFALSSDSQEKNLTQVRLRFHAWVHGPPEMSPRFWNSFLVLVRF